MKWLIKKIIYSPSLKNKKNKKSDKLNYQELFNISNSK